MKIDERITIYYFSATGNSLKMAQDLGAHFTSQRLVRIKPMMEIEHPGVKMVGFIFPVYMGGIPAVVREFMQKFPFEKGVYYFSVGTYYKYKGGVMSFVNKILRDKGVVLNYGNYLPSVGNCLMEYEVSENQRSRIRKRTDEIKKTIVEDIKSRVETVAPGYCRLSERFHKKMFDLFFEKAYEKFSLENNCVGCGICEKICPVNNVSLKENRPIWGKNCMACHACVHWCPRNAINIGRSKGRLQYRNSAVTKEMLFRST